MERSVRADVKRFLRELEIDRSTINDLSKIRQETSFLYKNIVFWMESARFLINELEIWGNLSVHIKYDATIHKLERNLDYLDVLVSQLIEEQGSNLDADEEDK